MIIVQICAQISPSFRFSGVLLLLIKFCATNGSILRALWCVVGTSTIQECQGTVAALEILMSFIKDHLHLCELGMVTRR
ncbi:hypothetical protein C8J56DRAFT_970432 [Mycena floridula]|nr:hypothetical protein C8J56DRAFT_970432 [Mycena floridula]